MVERFFDVKEVHRFEPCRAHKFNKIKQIIEGLARLPICLQSSGVGTKHEAKVRLVPIKNSDKKDLVLFFSPAKSFEDVSVLKLDNLPDTHFLGGDAEGLTEVCINEKEIDVDMLRMSKEKTAEGKATRIDLKPKNQLDFAGRKINYIRLFMPQAEQEK